MYYPGECVTAAQTHGGLGDGWFNCARDHVSQSIDGADMLSKTYARECRYGMKNKY
jgi:hypothetical protein